MRWSLLLFGLTALLGPPAMAGPTPDVVAAAPDTPDACSAEAPDACSAEAPDIAQAGAQVLFEPPMPLDVAAALDASMAEASPLIAGGSALVAAIRDGGRLIASGPAGDGDTPQPDTEQEAPADRTILPGASTCLSTTIRPPALLFEHPEEAATGIGVTPDALSS